MARQRLKYALDRAGGQVRGADFSSNAFHPQAKYKALIDHYRERLAYYGHDPAKAVVGAGSGSLYLGNTTEEAIRRYRPYYTAFSATESAKHNQSPFHSLEDQIENGPALIGSPEKVIEKIMNYHEAFGHTVLSIGVDGLTESEQQEQLQRFAEEVLPVLRREIPSRVWESGPVLAGEETAVLSES